VDLDAIFSKAQELPTIPKVVQELITSFDGDDFDVDDLAKKVGMDQVLTAKVLRLANSAKFGASRNVRSVNEAVVRMGFHSLRTLVLASGLTGSFKAPEGFDLKDFWRQSFARAELCRWLAGYTQQDPEVAFTCGMLSNIGELMVCLLIPDKAQEIKRVAEKGGDKHALERDAWGFTADDVTAKLATMWKFPASIIEGARYQSCPHEADTGAPLAALICLSNYILKAHTSGIDSQTLVSGFPGDVGRQAGADLSALLDRIEETRDLDSGMDALLE